MDNFEIIIYFICAIPMIIVFLALSAHLGGLAAIICVIVGVILVCVEKIAVSG